MKKTTLIIPFLMLSLFFSGCSNYGKEKTFNGVDLYHTENVTDQEADSLGSFLVSSKFADGNEKTVQLTKSGGTYNFRFVVKKGAESDESITKSFKYFASIISQKVFNGAPVTIVACDDHLNSLKSFPSDELGKDKTYNGVQLYHTKNIPDALADSLGKFLIASKFAEGKPMTAQIKKPGNTYQFKFVIKSGYEKDTSYLKNSKLFASELSTGVFGGAPVEVRLCDDYMNTLAVVPMEPVTK